MKRVLICGFTSNIGGMESYVMNIYRRIDRTKLQFDFLALEYGQMAFADEIKELGGRVIVVPRRKEDLAQHNKVLNDLLSNTEYEGMYYQCTRKLRTLELFKLAKKYKIPKRVIHAHGTEERDIGTVTKIRCLFAGLFLNNYVTDRWACSENAGKWMFGKSSFTIINNGVDTDLYSFDQEQRTLLRKEFGAEEDTMILGTVGRVTSEKNPDFLIDVFDKYHKKNPNSLFIHIGYSGALDQFKDKVEKLGLKDSYLYLGRRTDVERYLNAMDCFLLPSFHEGFPIVLVEAQTNGLKCLVSDSVTTTTNLTGLVRYLPISSTVEWEKELESFEKVPDRTNYPDMIKDKHYSVNETTKQVFNFFLSDKD